MSKRRKRREPAKHEIMRERLYRLSWSVLCNEAIRRGVPPREVRRVRNRHELIGLILGTL